MLIQTLQVIASMLYVARFKCLLDFSGEVSRQLLHIRCAVSQLIQTMIKKFIFRDIQTILVLYLLVNLPYLPFRLYGFQRIGD